MKEREVDGYVEQGGGWHKWRKEKHLTIGITSSRA